MPKTFCTHQTWFENHDKDSKKPPKSEVWLCACGQSGYCPICEMVVQRCQCQPDPVTDYRNFLVLTFGLALDLAQTKGWL